MGREWCYYNFYYHNSGLLHCTYPEALDNSAVPPGTSWAESQSCAILFPCKAKSSLMEPENPEPECEMISQYACPFSLNHCVRWKRCKESDVRKWWLKSLPSFFCFSLTGKFSAETLLGIQLKPMLAGLFYWVQTCKKWFLNSALAWVHHSYSITDLQFKVQWVKTESYKFTHLLILLLREKEILSSSFSLIRDHCLWNVKWDLLRRKFYMLKHFFLHNVKTFTVFVQFPITEALFYWVSEIEINHQMFFILPFMR